MNYYVVYVFPIERVYEALRKRLPPWAVDSEHELLSAVIRYWLRKDIALPLLPYSGDERIFDWSDLLNTHEARADLIRVMERPMHPSWNPQFGEVPESVRITSRSLHLRYHVLPADD